MRVVFFCAHKTYSYAQNEISYEYIQICMNLQIATQLIMMYYLQQSW